MVLGSLPAGVRLVAISKFHPNEYIEEAYMRTRLRVGITSAGTARVIPMALRATKFPLPHRWFRWPTCTMP